MSFIAAAGLAVGVAGVVGSAISRSKANKRLAKLQKENPTYTANPLAAQRLDLANTLLNARMPGAARAERNIYASGGNARGQLQRNATDGSQALALGAGIQGQEANQFNQLGDMEAQDYQRRYANQVNAQQGVINENDKVFSDETRRFGDKLQIQGAINANKQATWSDVSNLGFSVASFASAGGFSGMKGGGGMSSGMAGRYNPQNSGGWGSPQAMQGVNGGINPAYQPYIGGFNPNNNIALNPK